MLAQKERGGISNLVAGGYAAGGRGIDHGLIAIAVGIELVVGQGRDNDAWRDGVDTGTTLAPCGGCGSLGLQVVHVGVVICCAVGLQGFRLAPPPACGLVRPSALSQSPPVSIFQYFSSIFPLPLYGSIDLTSK